MLDPATAVAVTGIAIDVAKDLVEFFKAWSRCPEDAIELRASILWLGQTFHLVRKTLRDRQDLRSRSDSTYDTIITSVESCESKVKALRIELNKIQIEFRKDALQKIENQLKRFRYFFSKDKISDMLKNIKECESSLNLTISLLHL